MQCWGVNNLGQTEIPQGYFRPFFYVIDSGGDHSCGVTAGNTVKCWGRGSYKSKSMYESSLNESLNKVFALSMSKSKLAVGWSHNCVLDD